MSLIKISSVGENLYQYGEQEIPIDRETLLSILKVEARENHSPESFVDDVDKNGSGEYEKKTANKGVIVDVYEVEYPAPSNPMKETQELAKNLDEYNDFITQYLFPGSNVEDINVELHSQIEKDRQTKNASSPNDGIVNETLPETLDVKKDVYILPLRSSDVNIILDNEKEIHDNDVLDYVMKSVDWSKSIKAINSITGEMLGYYLFGEQGIKDEINYSDFNSKEDLNNYSDKKGLQGVSLFVKPEYRNLGIGRLLKDYSQELPYDYVWGYHSFHLNNLDHWLKRRRLVGQDSNAYVTLRDKE